MTPSERNAASLSHALDFYGEVTHQNELKLILAPVTLSVFNIALLDRPVGEGGLEPLLNKARAFFRGHNRPWSFWTCEDHLDRRTRRRIHNLMDLYEMTCIADTPGMEIEGMPQVTRPLPALECRPVADQETRVDFAELIAASFYVPPSAALVLYGVAKIWPARMQGWVGYLEGKPVATTVTVSDSEMVGLYSISTHPDHRRRGYAERLMRFAMDEAAQRTGLSRYVLQSSPAGLKLYRKMGFQKITRFLVFSTA